MSKIYSTLILCSFLLLQTLGLTAQNKNSVQNNDSINAIILKNYTKKIAQIEQQRMADSIYKSDLEGQLVVLKAFDRQKKQEIHRLIQELNSNQSILLSRKQAQFDSLKIAAKGSPVLGFFNDTLFLIYYKSVKPSIRERAETITQRIRKLAETFKSNSNPVIIAETETTSDLVCGETILMSITEKDAFWNNSTRQKLARNYQQIMEKSLLNYKTETSLKELTKEIGLALLVILITIVLIRLTGKLFRWTSAQIQTQEDKRIKGLNIRDYTLYDAKRQVHVFLKVNLFLKWMAIVLIIYVASPILFGIFPWTKNFSGTLLGYVLNPAKKILEGFWSYLPNLVAILVILFVFRYVLKGLSFLKSEIENGKLSIPGFFPDWANPTYYILRILVFAFMVVVIFPYLPGSDSPVFKGVSVFLGFLFTFGSAGSLSNIIAGLVITYMRMFIIGDRVKIGDVTGDVIEKSLLVTRIRTVKNEIISIPNSTVMNNHTINYSSDASEKGLIIHTTVTIGYDVPWRDMHQALIDAAKRTDNILNEPEPFVLQTSLDDFFVSYQVNAYTRDANSQARIYSGLHQNIQDVCNERGIEILSPHYRSARDGNASSIPASYLPKDYQAPGFNVHITKDPESGS